MIKTLIFIICLYAFNIQLADNNYPQDNKLVRFNGRPTTFGINYYVNSAVQQKILLSEFADSIRDTIYNDIYFRTIRIKDKSLLGYNLVSGNSDCEITITNEERFTAVEYDTLKTYEDVDNFLKPTVLHEICHYYFYQCILEMQKIKHLEVNQYYSQSLTMYPNEEMQYGAKFIEEGLCEYVTQHYKWSPRFNSVVKPQKKDFRDKNMKFEVQYIYASSYVKDFLDNYVRQYGRPKIGIVIILGNRPPSYEEILKPQSYFDRLNQQKNSEFTQSY